jgi:catechol 2,3-dioxygenase-like lactoylglutathione lyase family enzyme
MSADLGIDRIAHVKLPVTDVAGSAHWYAQLLDMRLAMEFVEDDQLRGVALEEPTTGIRIALRDRAYCSSHPVLAGFDVVAIEMQSLDALEALAQRCDRLGIENTGVHHFDGGAGMDVPDPDGTAIRFHYAPGRPPFMGVRSDAHGGTTVYDKPRLSDIRIRDG